MWTSSRLLRHAAASFCAKTLLPFVLAGALALAGLLAEAGEACAVARRLAPHFTIAKFRAEAVSENPVFLTQREHFYEGLRLAGVPEG
jgi:hypothetical protein